ncbi:MAG TPA: hypothetical protein VL737_02470 [Candidatus Pristimantibacillus sp.]|nr:hypothetical protein [Candidatus Pristimantibacillus sp.]
MAALNNEQMNVATMVVFQGIIPTEKGVLDRLNQLEPPQGWRVQRALDYLTNRGMDQIQAEKMALGYGLGILMMHEAANRTV